MTYYDTLGGKVVCFTFAMTITTKLKDVEIKNKEYQKIINRILYGIDHITHTHTHTEREREREREGKRGHVSFLLFQLRVRLDCGL